MIYDLKVWHGRGAGDGGEGKAAESKAEDGEPWASYNIIECDDGHHRIAYRILDGVSTEANYGYITLWTYVYCNVINRVMLAVGHYLLRC